MTPPGPTRLPRPRASYATLPLALFAAASSRIAFALVGALPTGSESQISSSSDHDARLAPRNFAPFGHGGEGPSIPPGTPEFYIRLGTTFALVCLGGLFAGLTIAYMSLDLTNLQILIASGSDTDKRYASKILPIRENGHLLLITLLLGTVVVNESIPILMDSIIGGGIYAVAISTLLVVIFGEIIPNAICNVYGLAVGSFFAPFVRMCMVLMWPFAYPIAKLLDCLLGEKEGVVYRRAELKTLIAMHQEDQGLGNLSADEVGIIAGVLDLSSKTVYSVMTPLEGVFTLGIDDVLDVDKVNEIREAGYSRIPVYEGNKDNLIAMFLVKNLVGYYIEQEWKVRDFPLSFLPIVGADTQLFDLLNFFQEGRSHIAAVIDALPAALDKDVDGLPDEPRTFQQEDSRGKDLGYSASDVSAAVKEIENGVLRKVVGIITLEDVIEELLGEEIVDETDVYADIASKQRVVRKPWQDLMASIHGFAATIPSRNLSSPLLKPLPVPVPHEGTEREPLLGKKSPGGSLRHQPSMSERKDLKEIKKQRLVEKAIKDGVFPGGLAGELIAGTLKRKEIKKIIRRRTEPILSPTREDAEEGVIDEGEGGQNL